MFPLLLILLLFFNSSCSTAAYSYQATTIPPLIDVPTWSLSTKTSSNNDDTDAVSTMNILTYASPVAIQPYRMWSISLYKGTLSHENFVKERRGILQLLRPKHALKVDDDIDGGKHGALIRVLGGSSGRDVDKETVCEELGFPWQTLECKGESKVNDDNDVWPKVLPHCVYYLKLELVGEMIDCGSHDVALCRVVDMVMTTDDENTNTNELDYISTRKLRDMDVISELGRIKEIS